MELRLAEEHAEEKLRESEGALRHVHEELQSRTAELARFNQAAVGRETRLIELKEEINQLLAQRAEPARYPLAFGPAPQSAQPLIPRPGGHEGLVPLESILRTEKLRERPARPRRTTRAKFAP